MPGRTKSLGQKAMRVFAAVAVMGGISAAVLGGVAGAATTTKTTTATATISGGTLAFKTAPANLSWSYTQTGLGGQHVAMVGTTESLDVSDARGSGLGWQVDLTSTTFKTSTAKTLPTTAASVQSAPATYTCDTTSTCVVGTNTITYPYVVPAATTAPAATAVASAAATTGMGNETVKVPFVLTVPANALAGTYTSTWTFSLVSGP